MSDIEHRGKIPIVDLKGLILCFYILIMNPAYCQSINGDDWYTQGDFIPTNRISITVTNPLVIPVKYQPVIINRNQLPVQNIPERWVNIVDPNLPSNSDPIAEDLKDLGGYIIGKETNGHSIGFQLDDLDKDGIWDEIFFLSDFAPNETRRFYIYFDFHERGLYPHQVHANIANYGHHTVPLFESESVKYNHPPVIKVFEYEKKRN